MSESDESGSNSSRGRLGDSSSEGSPTELDPTSAGFKPLRVLYSRKPQAVPVPSARLHDNVGTFESRFGQLGGFHQQYSDERLKEIHQARAATSKRAQMQLPSSSSSEMPQRRFLPHQGMIKAEKPAKFSRNILMKLEKTEGPLERMRSWMRERVRVKVYTRKQNGIRGYVTGFVEVFDKHWNMALVDVYESWKRRKYRYSENKLCVLGQPQDCSVLLRKMGIQVPEVSVRSAGRKYVMCSRRMPKLMIRGEQVVLVTPDSEGAKKEEKFPCQAPTPKLPRAEASVRTQTFPNVFQSVLKINKPTQSVPSGSSSSSSGSSSGCTKKDDHRNKPASDRINSKSTPPNRSIAKPNRKPQNQTEDF